MGQQRQDGFEPVAVMGTAPKRGRPKGSLAGGRGRGGSVRRPGMLGGQEIVEDENSLFSQLKSGKELPVCHKLGAFQFDFSL